MEEDLVIIIEILKSLKINLEKTKKLLNFFELYKTFEFLPISVVYSKIVPKTSRISKIFPHNNSKPKQISAEYIHENEDLKQIRVVYSCTKKDIEETMSLIQKAIKIFENNQNLEKNLKRIISKKKIQKISGNKINQEVKELIKANYKNFTIKSQMIVNDLCYIEDIYIKIWERFLEPPIFAFLPLKTTKQIIKMLETNGIYLNYDSFIASEFWNLDLLTVNQIVDLFPFLFSFATKDEEVEIDNLLQTLNIATVPEVLNQNDFSKQVIGVIDSKISLPESWAKQVLFLEENLLELHQNEDKDHGTQVASLVIANDLINQRKDGLGLFKLMSFNVLPTGPILTSQLMRKIEDIIIRHHKKSKIWNLSVGCLKDGNKVSMFGKLIDALQYKYGILFIISAGNKGKDNLVAPADSLTSISVGSLYTTNTGEIKRCQYSGTSKIFGLFEKPSLYEIGNNVGELTWDNSPLKTLLGNGKIKIENGTSFTAPLVARKAAYLMEKLNISELSTRALLNYLAKINLNHIPDLSILFENNSDWFIFIEGELKPSSKCEINVKLPHKEDKLNFVASYSLAYNVSSKLDMGDEYASTDITFRLANQQGDKRSNLLTNIEKQDGLNASEKELRKFFGKYNPNTILIDQDFKLNKKKHIKNINKFSFVLERTDLVDENTEEIRYGLVMHLKELEKGSLENFVNENLENMIEVIQYIDEDIEVEL